MKMEQEEAAKRDADARNVAETQALREQKAREQQQNMSAFGEDPGCFMCDHGMVWYS